MSEAITPPHTPWAHSLRTAILAALAVCVVLLAFAWPSVVAKPQNLPVDIVGSAEQISQIEGKLPSDLLKISTVDSRDAAVTQIKERKSYGAIVLGQSPEVLVSSAASPAVSQTLTQVAAQMREQINQQVIAGLQASLKANAEKASAHKPATQQPSTQSPATQPPTAQSPAAQQIPTVTVTDVVPLASTDSRGAGLAVAGFPLTMGGMLGGILISLLVSGTWRRLAAILTYGILGGLALAGVLQGWFSILQGNFILNAAAIGLSLAATSALITGMNALVGRAGIAVGAVVTLLIGNPISSLTMPAEFLPGAWGSIGQWFVPGAAGTLLRDLSYFPDASLVMPWLVLIGWAALGTIALVTGHFRNQKAVADV